MATPETAPPDAREAFPYFEPCRVCGYDPCLCENPWEEAGFWDEPEDDLE